MMMTVIQHTMPYTSEESAASIFRATSTMKNEATYSSKILVCITPKHIKDNPNLQ
jgi:hypothetical protein